MKHEAIPLLPAVRRTVDLLSDTVARGLRALRDRFGPPALAWRSNQPAAPDLGYALVMARRLHKILRYVFVILAARFSGLAPARPAPARGPRPRHAVDPGDPATWRGTFSISKLHRRGAGGAHAQPLHFAPATRDPLRTLARKMEGLRRALARPMRYVRRLARQLRRDVMYVARDWAKRPPPLSRRDYLDALAMARDQASWELRQLNTS